MKPRTMLRAAGRAQAKLTLVPRIRICNERALAQLAPCKHSFHGCALRIGNERPFDHNRQNRLLDIRGALVSWDGFSSLGFFQGRAEPRRWETRSPTKESVKLSSVRVSLACTAVAKHRAKLAFSSMRWVSLRAGVTILHSKSQDEFPTAWLANSFYCPDSYFQIGRYEQNHRTSNHETLPTSSQSDS